MCHNTTNIALVFVVFLFYNEIWFWFKKYAIKKTVRGELGKPSSAYFLDYYLKLN